MGRGGVCVCVKVCVLGCAIHFNQFLRLINCLPVLRATIVNENP